MVENNKPWKQSRRKILAATGSALSLSAIPATALASEDRDSFYENSLQLRRENNWSVDEWRNHLRNKGDGTLLQTGKASRQLMPDEDDGTFDTQHISDSSNLVLDISMYEETTIAGSFLYADMHFEANDSIWQLGKNPMDAVGFSWDQDEYDFNGSGDEWSASDESLIDKGSLTGGGVTFKFRDRGHVQEGHWISIPLAVEGGTPSTRNVICSYMHTYNQTEITDITINSQGDVQVTLTDSTAKWDTPVNKQMFEDNQV